jgi:serpin B
MPRSGFLIGLLAGGFLLACGDGGIEPITELPRPLTGAESQLVAADNRFAFKLLGAVAAGESGRNVFVSPLSVGMALGMTYNGAAGATEAAMRQTLELGDLPLADINASYRSVIDLLRNLDPSVEFTIANSLWYRQGFTPAPDFLDRVVTFFDATVTALDFSDPAAAGTINQWVNDQTGGRIPEIVTPPIPELTIAYLINAIYFKGDWTWQFERNLTHPGPFHRADGSEASVPLMSTGDVIPLRYGMVGDAQVLDLSYGGGAYRMTIVLPRQSETLTALAARATADAWAAWVSALDSSEATVVLPKFTLEYEQSLQDELSALGMEAAFCDSGTADFTAMFPAEEACISSVKHKTFVDVNEEGTEAAAATSVEIGLTSAPPTLTVDRPFIMAIREALSGTILFLGVIGDPGA